MHFVGLTATEFTMLFSSAAFLAVLFYLLSFRRRTAALATEPIWRTVLGRKKTPFRKLLALLGQILVLFVLALALADPRFEAQDQKPPVAMVAVVDVSASMSALEDDQNRLAQAGELLSAMAEALGPRDRMMLMAMDDGCRPLTGFSGQPEVIKQALADLTPSAVAEDFQRALSFAHTALSGEGVDPEAQRRVVVISDRFHKLPQLAPGVADNLELVQVAVGRPGGNLAVTAFEVRLRSGAARGHEVFVEVTNFGRAERTVTLSIHTEKDLLGEELLKVAGRDRVARSYFLKPVDSDRVMATLSGAEKKSRADRFALDDRAYALLPRREARSVLLVTGGNVFLEKALQLDPSLSVKTVKPGQYSQALLSAHQAVVFDGLCPPAPIPAMYFAPKVQPGCPFGLGEQVEFPKLMPLRGDHPVTEKLTLVDMQIQRSHRLLPQAGDHELLGDDHGPLILARAGNGPKLLAFGFDLAQSDLPLRVAFPMMIHNTLAWFLGETIDLGSEERSVGGLARLPDWVAAETRVADPRGRQVSPMLLGGRPLLRLRWPGFYLLGQAGHQAVLPVNFHLTQESGLAGNRSPEPDRLLWSEGDPPEITVAGFDKTVHQEPPIQWPILLLACAWLLLFDWLFFCFRMLF